MLQAKRRILAMLTVFAMLCSVFYTDGAAFVQAAEQETSQKENAKESAAAERIRRISRAAEEGEGNGDDFREGYYGYILSDEEFAGFMAEDTGAGTDWLETEIFNENLDSLLAELEASESASHNYWIGCSLENEEALNIQIPSGVKNIGLMGASVKLDSLTLGENTEQVLLEGSFTGSEHILTLDYTNAPEGKVGLRYASIEGFIQTIGDEPSGTLTLQDWNSVEGIDNIATMELLPYQVHERDEEGYIVDGGEVRDTGWNLEIRGKYPTSEGTPPIVFNDIVCHTEDDYTEGNFSIETAKQEDGTFRIPIFNGTIDLGSYYNIDDEDTYGKNISLRVIEDMDVEGDWQTVGLETGTQVAVLAEDAVTAYQQKNNIRYDGYEDDQHGGIDMDGSFIKDGEELFYVERLSSEEFNGTAEEWNSEWVGDAGSVESALALMDAESRLAGEEGSGLYEIGPGNGVYGMESVIELDSLDLTGYENVQGLRFVGERGDEEGNVFRPDFHLNNINLGEGQSLLLAGMRCISMEEETQPQDDSITVTGEGTLIFDTCRIYQAVEALADSEPTIAVRYDNTLSILTAKNVVLQRDSRLTVERNLEAENLKQEAYGTLLFAPDASVSIGNIMGAEEGEQPGINFIMGYWWEDSEEAWIYPQISIGDIPEGMSWLQITPYSVNEAADRGYPVAEDMYSWKYDIYGTDEMPYSAFDCLMGPEDLSGNILTLGTDAEKLNTILNNGLELGIAFSYCSMDLDMDNGIRTGGNPGGLYLSADSDPVAWVPFVVGVLSMEHAEVEAIPDKEYTGEQIRPTVVVTMDGELLVEGEDYILIYENNIEAGTARVIIRATEQSRYYGEKIVEFTIKAKETPGNNAGQQPGDNAGQQSGNNPQPQNPAPVAEPVPAKGTAVVSGSFKVKVTVSSADAGEVTVTGVKNKKLASAVIPATVKIDGYTFKVTEISKNAFKGCTKLKKVTIGKNVKTIGASAFAGCKSLKTIIIKSKVLKKVGKGAFKGIHAKAKIKVPKAKLKAYQKLLKGKGQKSTVKITK